MTNIDDAIARATAFVLDSRHPENGMWYNFLTRHHGESADWVSSFVGLNMLRAGTPRDELLRTAQSVLKRQREGGGFSYNHKIVPDADSTAFAVRFLSYFGFEDELVNARSFLAAHQHTDGSFATYREEAIRQYTRIPLEMSVAGWCAGTTDVTASALLALPTNIRAVCYLLNSQLPDGSWRAYWWTSDVYTTKHAAEALRPFGFEKEVGAAQRWLADDANVPSLPFYLALSIQALAEDEASRPIIDARVERLLAMQRTDDWSWNTQPILRFPSPMNAEPWTYPSCWREDASDQNRIFTTATCLKALSDYRAATGKQF
ncbi:terpene cyclase/mutase family protein [Candidatus Woesearchaeota archaeon]|nr:terpene cyclase/mutase family protein [Candidatus Woesearchaeota archaeon]